MKKRFMSALLCLCLLSGLLAVTAFADAVIVDNIDGTTGDGYAELDENISYSTEIDIYAQAIDNPDDIRDIDAYKVELIWGDMAFAWGYSEEQEQIWDPITHTYTPVERTGDKEWWLIDSSTTLSLPDGTDAAYADITASTKQNYVLMFNHSSKPVDANVSIVEVDAANNITASISDGGFGAAGTVAQDGSIDYALQNDLVNGVIYSTTNSTAAAAYVELSGEPLDGVLNDTTPTTVATVTVKLSLPNAA